MKTAEYWIEQLQLQPHPEGGWFREIYRSSEHIEAKALPKRFSGPRCFSTSIYFLLRKGQPSHLHRIASDEIWHYYCGSPLTLFMIQPQGDLSAVRLGPDPEKDEQLQQVMPAGCWFGAMVDDPDSFTLVGCTVAPGFEYSDFELGDRDQLFKHYPQHRALIERLTPCKK
ncbi:cupin domain-containing protein [bacterium]|nr:cupin domain-containing protein [bacterium]